MHLADAFIQSDLHCIQVTVFTFYQLLLSLGIEPMILALLAPCSTSWATGKLGILELQESYRKLINYKHSERATTTIIIITIINALRHFKACSCWTDFELLSGCRNVLIIMIHRFWAGPYGLWFTMICISWNISSLREGRDPLYLLWMSWLWFINL